MTMSLAEATTAQREAFRELISIEAQSDDTFYVETESARIENGWLVVDVMLACESFNSQHEPGGLRFNAWEGVQFKIPPAYPAKPPKLSVSHPRFAGYENVMRGGGICLFRSPDTGWDPAVGMAGFVRERVWEWFLKAARNEVDRQGGIFHVPVHHHLATVPGFIVHKAVEPDIEGTWLGYTRLRSSLRRGISGVENKMIRLDLIGWRDQIDVSYEGEISGAALLLPKRMGFYFPSSLDELFSSLESTGVSRKEVIEHLAGAQRASRRDAPLLFTIGVPISKNAAPRRHYLTTLYIPPKLGDLFWKAGGGKETHKAKQEVLSQAGDHPLGVLHPREHRPAVATRRDDGKAPQWLLGRRIAVWGCGGLGAPVALQAVRAGVDSIVLRDSGRVTPGVLVRQPYAEHDVDHFKVHALMHKLKEINPEVEVITIEGDVRDQDFGPSGWTDGADLVINATASTPVRSYIDQHRRNDEIESVPLATLAIGNRAERGFVRFLPAESDRDNADLERTVKRKVASEPNLQHFADAFFPFPSSPRHEPFYPEPGCSDSTFIGSAADMSALSGAMFNWIMQEARRDRDVACAFLCSQQSIVETGEIACLTVEADNYDTLIDTRASYDVRLRSGVAEAIHAHIEDAKQRIGAEAETGGPLFGDWDDARRVFWIDVADPAPPDSVEAPGSFTCGTEGLTDRNRKLEDASRGATGFIGTWHTHPTSPPDPSGRDLASMSDFFSRPERLPRRFLMMIVGQAASDPVFSPHVFMEADFVDA